MARAAADVFELTGLESGGIAGRWTGATAIPNRRPFAQVIVYMEWMLGSIGGKIAGSEI